MISEYLGHQGPSGGSRPSNTQTLGTLWTPGIQNWRSQATQNLQDIRDIRILKTFMINLQVLLGLWIDPAWSWTLNAPASAFPELGTPACIFSHHRLSSLLMWMLLSLHPDTVLPFPHTHNYALAGLPLLDSLFRNGFHCGSMWKDSLGKCLQNSLPSSDPEQVLPRSCRQRAFSSLPEP